MLNTLRFIASHPFNRNHPWKGLFRFLKWQFKSRLFNKSHRYSFTEKTSLLISRGMTGATGNIYCGLLEYEDMAFLLHFLRPEDYFFDIGANVGVYTILASGEIGASSVCIEPVPSTFNHLSQNIKLNELNGRVNALNMGLGDTKGMLRFTSTYDTVNHVATAQDKNFIEVKVETLDALTEQFIVPALIKIDVEGYETPVLQGAQKTLESRELKAIIIELNGSGKRYGYDEYQIHQLLLSHGFKPHQYNPEKQSITPLDTYTSLNTIYLRDLKFIEQRLQTSRRFRIGKQYV
jgi:FkbM family methyltransferase